MMKYFIDSLLIIFFLNFDLISTRSFDFDFSSRSDSNELMIEYNVVPKSPLILHKTDNDEQSEMKLGQISGLAGHVTNPNILYIFHRGTREWNEKSFPDGIHFDENTFGPIKENTILSVDIRTGNILHQYGNSTFSMPHGLTSDREGNLWLTDVAMHQVFKYGQGKILLRLGQSFQPGNDEKHFCKPTDVAITDDGSKIFVADGYCNNRVVVFDSNGNYLKEYSMKNHKKQLLIPHSLTLIEKLNLLCVADRENGRIVCFDAGLNEEQDEEGTVKAIIQDSSMSTVYAIHYQSNKERLYAISGRSKRGKPLGFTFSVDPTNFGQLIKTWKPNENFGEPHDLTVNINGKYLFVGEIHPNRIDSFDLIN